VGEIAYAHTIKIRALAKLGELLSSLEKAKGAAAGGTKTGPRGTYTSPRDSVSTLADLGISKKLSSIAQQLASQPPEIREAIAQRETTIAQVRREQRAIEVQRVVSLPGNGLNELDRVFSQKHGFPLNTAFMELREAMQTQGFDGIRAMATNRRRLGSSAYCAGTSRTCSHSSRRAALPRWCGR